MPKRMMLALLLMTAAIGPASAQDNDRGGVRPRPRTASCDRAPNDMLWNAIGLFGPAWPDRASPAPFRRQLSPGPARIAGKNRRDTRCAILSMLAAALIAAARRSRRTTQRRRRIQPKTRCQTIDVNATTMTDGHGGARRQRNRGAGGRPRRPTTGTDAPSRKRRFPWGVLGLVGLIGLLGSRKCG